MQWSELMQKQPRERWDLGNLQQCPEYEVLEEDAEGIRSVLYASEPYLGRNTRVFAYLGVPKGEQPVPGMVLVHGGGGTAFKEWVQLWNRRGYAAIAMDLAGCGPERQPLPDGGPDQDEETKFFRLFKDGWENSWTYHAIAAIMRAHSLLKALPGVDGNRIGLTGISWGGYLTCIAAAVDSRFVCAIPVYGCGFLKDNSKWLGQFAKMTREEQEIWVQLCDPSSYLGLSEIPMLFVNGTNDHAYPLDSYKRSYSLVRSPVSLAVRVGMGHSHEKGWAPEEIYRFADAWLRNGPMLPRIGSLTLAHDRVTAQVTGEEIERALFCYTLDTGEWVKRVWQVTPADVEAGTVEASLPPGTTVCFLAVEDGAGGYASSPHWEVG